MDASHAERCLMAFRPVFFNPIPLSVFSLPLTVRSG